MQRVRFSASFTAGLVLAALVLTPLGQGPRSAGCRADDQPANTAQQPAATNPPAAKQAPQKPITEKPNTEKPNTAKSVPGKPARVRPALPPFNAEREAAALAFAREHHPELASLIEKLRQDNRRQFDQAIRDLAQNRERLVRLKKLSPPQYDLALAAWKLDSRAHLLAARMTMSQDPALEAELKQVLRERVDLRLKQYHFERSRLADLLAKVNKSIEKLEPNKEAVADAELQRIKRSVAKSRRPASKKRMNEMQTGPAKPVVAERPRVPADKTAASVTAPGSDSTNGQSKAKQD